VPYRWRALFLTRMSLLKVFASMGSGMISCLSQEEVKSHNFFGRQNPIRRPLAGLWAWDKLNYCLAKFLAFLDEGPTVA
jgi:hypothetical protein